MTTHQKQGFNLMLALLGRIAKQYQTPEQLRLSSKKSIGLDYEEALEMSYENIQGEAEALYKTIKPIPASTSNMAAFAELELELLSKKNILKPLVGEIVALVEKYASLGHSGSASQVISPVVAQAIRQLLAFEPLGPLTGKDEEWFEVDKNQQTKEIIFQNKRCGTVFKDQDGKSWFLDALIWKNQHGKLHTGPAIMPDGSEIYSRQFIRKFPFDPKKQFTVDVIETEVAPDDWESRIVDETQLLPVWKLYERYYDSNDNLPNVSFI